VTDLPTDTPEDEQLTLDELLAELLETFDAWVRGLPLDPFEGDAS